MKKTFLQKALIKPFVWVVCCLIISSSVSAKQIPTVTGLLKSIPSVTTIIPGDSVTTSVAAAAGSVDYNIRNTVTLKYDQFADTFFLNAATVEVKLRVGQWDAASSSINTTAMKLRIGIDGKYNSPMLEQYMYKLYNGYKLCVVLDSIWVNGTPVSSLPRYVAIESDIDMNRYYDFSLPANTGVSAISLNAVALDCDTLDDEIEFSWTPNVRAEEYQVEWAYVNNYDASGLGTTYAASQLSVDFKNNSTRITTYNTSFRVSLLYNKGFVAFRVRAVGRDYLNPDKFIYGPWSVTSDQPVVSSLGSGTEYYAIAYEHEKEKNWQYSATYAEEGKKKEVINYFDGSLHNRQTVTKSNSDRNVIVGETLYDYQGRPAINVLPVPVVPSMCTEPAIKYYVKFNVDDTNNVYSKNDFDLDGGSCVSAIAPMDTTSGASQYYSNNNPDQTFQQGLLPHAKEYPFTQTEYTPDNTGRIRNQSGVGKDFQLGTNKETKYLYGQPNQIQVDRLFGSETGDASHYKKNIVIDPNGQTSVTYQNQSGKTIATALAGDLPTDTVSGMTSLQPLNSSWFAPVTFTIDLFNKDANGVSLLNTIPPSYDAVEFSSQLLVPYASNYRFDYKMLVDTLGDPCLKSSICIGCVYNLKIKVTDECGQDLVPSVNNSKAIDYVIGKVDTTGNQITFNMNCVGSSLFQEADTFNLFLQPGVYTVSKLLKINSDAKDFYVKNYLDTTYNSCVKTLDDFLAEEIAKIDTMDCYNSCSSCVADLGTKDDYVSAGKGTAVQWDLLYEACTEPCREKTLCDNTLEMMLSDVSPGGQYAKYNPNTNTASGESLSVLNTGNLLNANVVNSNQGNWKYPRILSNGNFYNMYLDENAERTKVIIAGSSPNYTPALDNNALVYTDTITNQLFTYPENLANLEDFLPVWNGNFAKSLVLYHPEYAYYKSCKEQSIIFPGQTRSSDMFDSLMNATESFAEALTNGFIDNATYLTNIPGIQKVMPFWSWGTLTDPFAADYMYNYQYFTTANSTTGSKTSYDMLSAPDFLVVTTEMSNRVYNYKVINNLPYTMADIAAIITRCGNNFNAAPTATCMAFGSDFYPYTTPLNDTIRNQEWRVFKSIYLSEKQKVQFKRMEFYAKHCDGTNSNFFGGSNCCFGNPSYDVVQTGMMQLNMGVLPYPQSAFFDSSQPCGFGSFSNYAGVTKRFYDPSNINYNPNQAAQAVYEATGQCPIAFELQGFLNAMAEGKLLDSIPVYMNNVGEFTPDIYTAINGGINPPNYINFKWTITSNTGGILKVDFLDTISSVAKCSMTLDINGTSIPAWDSIIGITQLVIDPLGTGSNPFKAIAAYKNGGTYSDTIHGNSCLKLKSCVFTPECKPNQLAADVLTLFNVLNTDSLLTAASPYSLYADPVKSQFITNSIKTVIGVPNNYIKYEFVAPNKLTFYDSTNTTTKLIFTITSFTPNTQTLDSIVSFNNINSNYNNLFTMDGYDSSNTFKAFVNGKANKVTSTDTIGVSMGDCQLPEGPECDQKGHKVRKDLEKLVKEIFTISPLTNPIDIFDLYNFTPLLQSYLPPGTDTSSSSYVYNSGAPNYDTLTFDIEGCNFGLLHYRADSTLNFSQIVNVTNLTGIGVPDISGNYTSFMALATYSVALDSLVTDTIYGQSCWPIKNCPDCSGGDTLDVDDLPNNNGPINPAEDNNNVILTSIGTYAYSCDSLYYAFVAKLASYDTSAYASTNSDSLNTLIYPTELTFAQAGYCGCGADYNLYLDSFIVQGAVTGPLPFDIDHWQGCPHVFGLNACDSLYYEYVATVGMYNDSVNANVINYPTIDTIYTPTYFNKVCSCAKKFIANLTAMMNGTPIPASLVSSYITLKKACEYPLCNGGPPDTAFVFPPVVYQNPCVQQQYNIAAQNAANSYQQYIDSMTTVIATLYSKHCLGAFESFENSYTDKEYQFTLYYYDQAGNLIRTIPPEGVDKLTVTSYLDAQEQQIIYDRTNGQQNVFMAHRMPTGYVYNSLNQLVLQTMPDHDNMNLCLSNYPNGLDTSLAVTSLQFVNANKGYLCGTAKLSSTQQRGYMYTSNDGGGHWARVNGVVSGDIQKTYFVDSLIGYASSSEGMLLKTIDGGNSWDLLTSLYNPISGLQYFDKVNDVYFTSATDGIVGGIKASGQGAIYYTTDGGVSFVEGYVAGVNNGDTLTGITYDGAMYYASFKNGIAGKVFLSNFPSYWYPMSNFVVNNLVKTQYVYDTLAYAVGEDGTLLRSTSAWGNWEVLPTGQYKNFMDVHFKNRQYGVAIIDSSGGKGKIYKTFNGGITWVQLSNDGDHYNAFKGYGNDTTQAKLIATGENGLLAKVLMTSTPFGIAKLSAPTSENYTFADAVVNDSLPNMLGVVVSQEGRVHLSYNAQAQYPTWESYYSGNLQYIGADSSYKKILVSVTNSGMPDIKALTLTNNGQLYAFYKSYYGTPTMSLVTYGSSTSRYFADITTRTQQDVTDFFAFDTISKQMYKIEYNGSNDAIASILTNAASGNVVSAEMSNISDEFMIVGSGGNKQYGFLSGSSVTWIDMTQVTDPAALNRIKGTIYGDVVTCGIDGAIWNYSSGYMRLVKTGITGNLKSLSVDRLGRGLICGNNGLLYRMASGFSGLPSLTQVSTPVTSHFNDAAIDTTTLKAYVTAQNGKVIYMSSYLSSINQLASTATNKALNGAVFKPGSTTAYAMGNEATIISYVGLASATNKNIFSSRLNSVHFYDVNNGYVIDSANVIRKTSDGGQTWQVALPDPSLPLLTKVYSTKSNQAVIVGMGLYAGVLNSTALSPISVSAPGSFDFYDIDFNNSFPNNGMIAGSYSSIFNIDATSPTSWYIQYLNTAGQPDGFRTLKVFNDTSCIAAGERGIIYYYKGGAFYQQQAYILAGSANPYATTFKDIFFHDNNRGYVVGDNGAAIKCTLPYGIQTDGLTPNNILWDQFCPTAIYPGTYGNSQIQNLDFWGVSFTNPTKGMIAGADNNFTTPFYSQKYAALVNDQGGFYSTRFWYDKLGRMVLSQNTKQYNKLNPDDNGVSQAFSYTKYDALGRITEVGEKFENHATFSVPTPPKFTGIFGSDVNNFYNVNTIDDSKLTSWINSTGRRVDVTSTYYDEQIILPTSVAIQNNLRKRVATVSFEDIYDGYDSTYHHATHYNYDIHGNVKDLWQENPDLVWLGQNFKHINYDYDLISGKVNRVIYQPDSVDMFIHKYTYDADNRITKVETSKDDFIYETDAKYFYYAHGPLARVEYGKNQVQGMDFAYTLQGWIKGVNSNNLNYSNDPGRDGDTTNVNPNGSFGRDAVGYTLNYYKGDYEAIDFTKWNTASTRFEAYINGSDFATFQYNLFNGNISSMVTTLSKPDTLTGNIPTAQSHYPLGNTYQYDQLNRLIVSNGFLNLDTTASVNSWQSTYAYGAEYSNYVYYDYNGNIQYYAKSDSAGGMYDYLVYNYELDGSYNLKRNRLYHVNDYAGASAKPDDIEDQGTFNSASATINQVNNYRYDEIGNLVHDSIEEIDTISWNVYGKIKYIKRINGSGKFDLYFDYDANGNRIAKRVYDNVGSWQYSTYYVRDAQGNVMSVYDTRVIGYNISHKQTENHLYGSSRLGIAYPDLEMIGAIVNLDSAKVYLGNKQYELSNHLGNVLATVSDKKIPINDNNTDSIIDYYVADLINVQDYAPFGEILTGRHWGSGDHRYGFNGKEKDDEVKGSGNSYDFGARINDPRLGRWLSVDPLIMKFPGQSPYCSMDNSPLRFADPSGMGTEDFVKDKAGNIKWDKDANSQETTKEGETYLGKTLTFNFNSYIDKNKWDGPVKSAAGNKLTSEITLTATENDKGEITGLSGSMSTPTIGSTPMGTALDYYPGKGGSNNVFATAEKKNADGTLGGFGLVYEQHASVSPIERFGLHMMGYKIVDVAQRLDITFGGGTLKVVSSTDIFPSATLKVNGNQIMYYPQPSFLKTHTAPAIGSRGDRDYTPYPSTFYKR